MDKKKIIAIVLYYNGPAFLDGCLHSLLNQSHQFDQILVVDNGSDQKIESRIKNKYPAVKIIRNTVNRGVAAGFNRGIKAYLKHCHYFALFNCDIKLDKKWLEKTTAILAKNKQVDVCTGLVYTWDKQKIDNAGGKIVNLILGNFGGFMGQEQPAKVKKNLNKPFLVFFGLDTAMLVRASAFQRYGLFDRTFFMYFEDIDFCWRLRLAGREVWCEPRAITYHFGGGVNKDKKLSRKIASQLEKNLLLTYYKNFSSAWLAILLPLTSVCRLVFALSYVVFSPRIAWGKTKNVFCFWANLCSGQYVDSRREVQKQRQISDKKVLKSNPGGVLAISQVVKMIKPWFDYVKKNYQ